MTQRDLPTLSNLYVERAARLFLAVGATRDEAKAVTFDVTKLPPWEHFEREATTLRDMAKYGMAKWPPEGIFTSPPQFRNAIHDVNPRHWQTFCRLPSVDRMFTKVIQNVAKNVGAQTFATDTARAGFQVGLQALHGWLLWREAGQKVFVLDPTTFELLLNTDVPDFPAHELYVPLGAFYLKFPRGKIHVAIDNGPPQPVEGVVVHVDATEGTQNYERCLGIQLAIEVPTRIDPDNRIASCAATYDIPMAPMRLLSQVASGTGHGEQSSDWVDVAAESGKIDAVPHIVVNFLLYLTSAHPLLTPVPPPTRAPRLGMSDLRSERKKRKLSRQLARTTQLGYVYVGGSDDGEETYRGPDGPDADGNVNREAHWVRGHWRKQKHGPSLSLTKRIWIRPHLWGIHTLEHVMKTRSYSVQPAKLRSFGAGA